MQELRTTTGQRVIISYDQIRNALTFHESDWFADPLRSTSIPVKSKSVLHKPVRNVVPPPKRRRIA